MCCALHTGVTVSFGWVMTALPWRGGGNTMYLLFQRWDVFNLCYEYRLRLVQ